MKRSIFAFTLLVLALPLLATGQMGKNRDKGKEGRSRLKLDAAETVHVDAVKAEFKVPRGSKTRKVKSPTAIFTVRPKGVNAGITLRRFHGDNVEGPREQLMKVIQEQHPEARTRIKRNQKYGGMTALTITFDLKGRGLIYTIVDMPYYGLVAVRTEFSEDDKADATRLHEWLMDSYRMSGKEGEDLLFKRGRVHYASGLGYRPPIDGKPSAGELKDGAIYEGRTTSGALVTIAAVEAKDDDLKALLTKWAGGAKALAKKGTSIPSKLKGAESLCLTFDKYSGRPVRALAAYRPAPGKLFKIDVAGGENPQRDVERLASVLTWHDIEKEEAETAGWKNDLVVALKEDDERKQRKIGRKLLKRYYLEASHDLCHMILKSGTERAQEYALAALGRGGSVQDDFTRIRACIKSGRFKDRRKMRIAGCEALANMCYVKVTNTLHGLTRDKDTLVAKAAVLALGEHHANRKLIISKFMTGWSAVLRDGKSKNADKQMKRSRLADAYRVALSSLMGTDLKTLDDAKEWWKKNSATVAAEEPVRAPK